VTPIASRSTGCHRGAQPGRAGFSIKGVRIGGAVLGVLLVGAVWVNVAVTLVIPRGRVGFIKVVDRFVDRVYTGSGRLVSRWDRRDALLASQPVATLALLLVIWLVGFLVGYGLLLWLPGGSFPDALREAGSSLFTLGFAVRSGTEPNTVEFLAAASGLIIVALQIAYLPTLYAAYNRRETVVTLLGPRAGSPAWGPELLARAQMVNGVEQLTVIYDDWERWSADVAEFHSSYPSLLRFRSPEPHSSWVVSQLAVLDAAALHLAACPSSAPFTARLCVQMGFTCLRKLTRTLRIAVDEDPRPRRPGPAELGGVPARLGPDYVRRIPRGADSRRGLAALPGLADQLRDRGVQASVGPRRGPRPLVRSGPPRLVRPQAGNCRTAL
jgi:hypothetical protein